MNAKIKQNPDGSREWSGKDKFYSFYVGDSELDINKIKIYGGHPASLVPNYDSKEKALNTLAKRLEELKDES